MDEENFLKTFIKLQKENALLSQKLMRYQHEIEELQKYNRELRTALNSCDPYITTSYSFKICSFCSQVYPLHHFNCQYIELKTAANAYKF